MPRALDLTGQRFGRLIVSTRVANRGSKTAWLARCDCGGETEVRSTNLKNGHTRSCGCMAAAAAVRNLAKVTRRGHPPLVDLTGRRFGKWVVVQLHHREPRGKSWWLCKSDDGELRVRRRCAITADYKTAYQRADKNRINKQRKIWWQQHKGKWLAYQKLRYELNKAAILARRRPYGDEQRRRYVADLADPYIRRIIHVQTGLRASDIPAPLVEAKRVHLKLRRLLKEKQR